MLLSCTKGGCESEEENFMQTHVCMGVVNFSSGTCVCLLPLLLRVYIWPPDRPTRGILVPSMWFDSALMEDGLSLVERMGLLRHVVNLCPHFSTLPLTLPVEGFSLDQNLCVLVCGVTCVC